MSHFEVAPPEVRSVGARLKTFAPSVDSAAAEMVGVAGSVSEPKATAAALDEMSAQWWAGLQRLSDDILIFGGLTQLAANGYETVDQTTMPEVVGAPDPSPLDPGPSSPFSSPFSSP